MYTRKEGGERGGGGGYLDQKVTGSNGEEERGLAVSVYLSLIFFTA